MPYPPSRLLPDYELHGEDDSLCASARFPEQFAGVEGVVHGGVVSMFFDEILGLVANHVVGEWWATAKLQVEFRKPTPIGEPIELIARLVRREGRKCVARGELRCGTVICAEAEALFVKVQ